MVCLVKVTGRWRKKTIHIRIQSPPSESPGSELAGAGKSHETQIKKCSLESRPLEFLAWLCYFRSLSIFEKVTQPPGASVSSPGKWEIILSTSVGCFVK